MFGSSTLDVALGLSFVYVLFSLMCMGVHELLAATVNLRANTLWQGIKNLIRDDALARELYAHPLIRALDEPGLLTRRIGFSSRPAYIDPAVFAAALIDTLAPSEWPLDPRRRMEAVFERVSRMQPGDFRRTLFLLANESGLDVRAFHGEVAVWFQRSMDAVAGRYKLGVQWRLLAVGAVIAVTCNLVTFSITSRLGTNQTTQRVLVAQAQAEALSSSSAVGARERPTAESAQRVLDQLNMEGAFPIGWQGGRFLRPASVTPHIPGWMVSALALSFLAPLWFDVLNRIGIMRSTVKPVERPIDLHGGKVDSGFSSRGGVRHDLTG